MTDKIKKTDLENLGFNEFFESEWKQLEFPGSLIARVVAEYKEEYRVRRKDEELKAKVTGRQMFRAENRADYPAVGDWVVISEAEKKSLVIRHILPRQTILKKKYSDKLNTQIIATNIDTAFIVESMDGDYNLNRFERYLVLAKEGGIDAVIVINKADLLSEQELNERIDQIWKRFPGIKTIVTSAVTGHGINELTSVIGRGKTYCFLGSSGVGKSSLINKLLGTEVIRTGEISHSSGKGTHTTTTRQMYFLKNGGILIDNPGTREVGITEAGRGIEKIFDEITALSGRCKFSDCNHMREPGCEVQKAVKNKELDEEKYQNYMRLKKESDHYEMTSLDKRVKDRRFGRFVKKAKFQSKKFKSGK